jgi:hypothetical protein
MTSNAKLANLRGNGQYSFAVVGESHYQAELEELVGGRTEESAEHYCQAELIPEPDNPFDRNAVYVSIAGEKVGYLPRQTVVRYNEARLARAVEIGWCAAVIVGGWERGEDDRGHFGVKLDVAQPFHFEDIRNADSATYARHTPITTNKAEAIRAGRRDLRQLCSRALIVLLICASAAVLWHFWPVPS